MIHRAASVARIRALYPQDAFGRKDEGDDAEFYRKERPGPHIDSLARSTVERIIGTLVIEPRPVILDLMAGGDSHLPASLEPDRVVGLGLSGAELDANPALDQRLVHDLNRDPELPFAEATFDVVLNTLSVAYLTRPFDVFEELGRVLKPGGLLLVMFSNRFFPPKAVNLWRRSSELERQLLVEDYFRSVPQLGQQRLFVSRGRPRPAGDRWAAQGLPSDPIWALYAEKQGRPAGRAERPAIDPDPDPCPPPEVVAARKRELARTLRCPYCEQPLAEWEVSQTPFTEWDQQRVYVCLNNQCPYLISGWDEMARQGNQGFSYRLMYVPEHDRCYPTPVANPRAASDTKVTPRG